VNISFEWDEIKNKENIRKHGINFILAQYTFIDSRRVIARDLSHSSTEKRYFCFGKVKGGVLTVRFTYRKNYIRIIGAGYWRKGKKIYEKQNKI
jgi:hypothetical protein